MQVDLPFDYVPRWYQLPSWNALWATGSDDGNPETDVRRAYLCHHRRAGKDLNMFNLMQCKIAQRRGIYAHIFPTLTEGRRVIWNGMDREGRRYLDYIPGHKEFASSKTKGWVVRKRDDEMSIEYANGAIYLVLGADHPDSVRGMAIVGAILSEYAYFKGPQIWDIIRPMLAENGGWMAAVTTPDGRNHAYALQMAFRRLVGKGEKIYFEETLPASLTGAVDPARIQEDRDSGMSEEKISSEYECSVDAPVEGSYYGKELQIMREEGRFTRVPHERDLPVNTYWDIGVRDATCIWYGQNVGREHHIIDFDWFTGAGLNEMAKELKEKPYNYGRHYVPHDMDVKEIGADYAATRVQTALKLGLKVTVLPRRAIQDGINATRSLLRKTWIDDAKCELGISALHQYRKKKIEGIVGPKGEDLFTNEPEHTWACLHPETRVLTRNGTCRIVDLPPKGEVATPWGLRRYENPHRTRGDAPLVEVFLSDGSSVKCTPEHRWLTESGWRFAEDLERGSKIRLSSRTLRKFSRAASIASGPARIATSAEARASCTELCGRVLSGISPGGIMFTTATAFAGTTGSRTWNSCQPRSTRATTLRRKDFPQRLEQPLPTGIDRNRAASGIVAKPIDRSRGKSGSAKRRRATGAAMRLWPWFARGRALPGSAARAVEVLRVERIGERSDVWCLTVPDTGCFGIEGGATVANSHPADSLRTGAMGLALHASKRGSDSPPTPQIAIV